MNAIKAASVLQFLSSFAAAFPAAQGNSPTTTTTTTYACNPAHSYPGGAQCISTAGSLTLVTPSASSSSSAYACNPAHSYPEGVTCVSTNGALTLVTPSATTTTYACNPAHSYPEGVTCISTNGALALVTPSATSTGYACNPAHSYPEGVTCVSTNGALALVTPSATATTYACNPAHSYPEGVTCVSTNGALTLVTPSATSTSYACNPAHSYPNGAICTDVQGSLTLVTPTAWIATTTVTNFVTYCPQPTKITVDNKVITVTSATTLTVPVTTTVSRPVIPTSAAPSSSAYLCNPAHSYPDGVTCDATARTLIYPSTTASSARSSAPTPSSAALTGDCPLPATVTVTSVVTVAQGSSSASRSATSGGPVSGGPASSASACVTTLFDGCNPARSSCPNGPGTFVTVTPSTYPTTYFIGCNPAHTSCSTGPGTFVTISSAPSVCVTASATSSAALHSASSTGSQSSSALIPSATATGKSGAKCPLDLPAGSFEYPHRLEVNGVNGYFGKVDRNTNTSMTFDIPAADAGKNCNTYFSLPDKKDLETADYNLTLVDGAKITVSKSGQQVAQFTPEPNKAYLLDSQKCSAAGQVNYTISTGDSVEMSWFNDYNPCALGAFIVVS